MNMHKDIATENGLVFSQLIILICVMLVSFSAFAADPVIKESKDEGGDNKIQLKVVKAGRRAHVTVSGVETGKVLGTFRANKRGKLEAKFP